jgi:hypothetical protein
MEDRITEKKLAKYFGITSKALEMAKKAVAKGKEKEAGEILKMASGYFSDAGYFRKKGDVVNAFAAVNYSHGWLDTGARLGIFAVKNTRLFTIK